MVFHSGRIAAHETLFEPAQTLLGRVGAGFQGGFAEAGQPAIGVYFQEHEVPPAQRDLVNLEVGDLQLAWTGSGPERRRHCAAERPQAGSPRD